MSSNKFNCPLCAAESKRIFAKHDFWLRDCLACKHRFAEIEPQQSHVSQIYGDDYFSGGKAGYADYLSEADILRAAGRRYGNLVKKHAGGPGEMLDVGAAAGFILKGFKDAGWSGEGIEPNARMAQFAREQLNLAVTTESFENFSSAKQFDLISLVQVIAHFQEPFAAFEQIAQLTKPRGFLLVETWRRDSFAARSFGKNWHEYSPPSVLQWFTKSGLANLVGKFDFKVVATGRPEKWLNAAHAKSLINYKLAQMPAGKFASQFLKLVPDRLSLPYMADDLFWLLCQKQ